MKIKRGERHGFRKYSVALLARRNTAIYLRRSQIEVDEAVDGEEAIRLITSIDQYDVLISDLRMPGLPDGMDVISCR